MPSGPAPDDGSDWPVCLLAPVYDDVVAIVRDALAEYSEDSITCWAERPAISTG